MERQLTTDHLLFDKYLSTNSNMIDKTNQQSSNIFKNQRNSLNPNNLLTFSTQIKNLLSSNTTSNKLNLQACSKNSLFSNKNSIKSQFNEIKADITKTQKIFKRRLTQIHNENKSILKKINIDYQRKKSIKNLVFSEEANKLNFQLDNYDEDNFIRIKKSRTKVFERVIMKHKKRIYDSLSDDETLIDNYDKFSINPNNFFLALLNLFAFILILISLFYTPLLVAFRYNITLIIVIFDILSDFILILFIFLNFTIGYVDEEDNLILKRNRIIIKYIKTWLIFDILTGIPFNSITNIYSYSQQIFSKTNIFNDYKFDYTVFRMLRCLSFFKLFQKISINKNKKLSNLTILLSFFIKFLILTHLASCFWISLTHLNHEKNWVSSLKLDNSSNGDIYVTSYYFVLVSILTVGYGDIVATNFYERLFNSFLLIFGIFLYTLAISSISNYVYKLEENEKIYSNHIQTIDDLHTKYDLSLSYTTKVKSFLNHKFLSNNEDKINLIRELPLSLKREITFKIYSDAIKKFWFIRNLQDKEDILLQVLLNLKAYKFNRYEYIINQDQFLEEVLFISKGKVMLERKVDLFKMNKQIKNILTSEIIIKRKSFSSQISKN